jgi:hypothetical protein
MHRVESFEIFMFVFTAPELIVRPSSFIYDQGGSFSGGKRPEREAGRSSALDIEVKNVELKTYSIFS